MTIKGAKQQTLFLTGINGVVRALGLMMRVLLSRFLGAEIMGIMELAQSVHMVAIAPLTSGLPAAVSRLTAKADAEQKTLPLASGIRLTRLFSLFAIPAFWFFSGIIAHATGDMRVMPSLWFSAPCILILGYSAVYNGFCYGTGLAHVPAVSELLEQCLRLIFTLSLAASLRHLTAAWMAAIPTAATMLAEAIGLLYVMKQLKHIVPLQNQARVYQKEVLHLSIPTTITRCMQTLLRSVTAIAIPLRLQHSGLTAAEATARLGMLNGMVMPILMLPSIFTSALSMVMIPRIAQAEQQPSELRRLLLKASLACIPFSALCAAGIAAAAPFLSARVYRLAELTHLFHLCAPMTLLFSANHLAGSALSALGMQKKSLFASAFVSVLTLGLTWLWAGSPSLRLVGVIRAQYAGSMASLLLSVWILKDACRKSLKPDDRSV